MDAEKLWTTILIPVFIAPLSWILSRWYQNTQQLKFDRKREAYNIKKREHEECLNLFLYPVFFKLLLIYQLDFNIPDDFNYHNDGSNSSKETETSDTSDISESESENEIERVRCIGYYKKTSGKLHKCRNEVPVNDTSKVCKTCRWKYANDKIKLRLQLVGEGEGPGEGAGENDVKIETDVIDKRSSFRNRSASYIRVQMPEELDESELIEHKVNRKLSKMSYLRSCISEDSIKRLNTVILELYREVKGLIETNIHVIKPNARERNIYVNLVRFIELKTVLGCSDREIERDYGRKKNLATVLSLVHDKLHNINESYSGLILEIE